VSPSWFARFQQLSCRKALIYGELSLPAQEADDVVAAGIPLLVVPDAGHSMAWENPVALADCMAQFFGVRRRTAKYRRDHCLPDRAEDGTASRGLRRRCSGTNFLGPVGRRCAG
jgi:hypothetical protein